MTTVDLDFAPAAYRGACELIDIGEGDVRVIALFDGWGSWGLGPDAAEHTSSQARARWQVDIPPSIEVAAAHVTEIAEAARAALEGPGLGEDTAFSGVILHCNPVALGVAAAGFYSVAVGSSTGAPFAFEARMLLAKAIAEGMVAPEDAHDFPHKNVCMGPYLSSNSAEPLEISHHQLAPGQRVLVAVHQVATALNLRQTAWADSSASELQELGVQLGERAHPLLLLRCR